jgi:hypothetical protein
MLAFLYILHEPHIHKWIHINYCDDHHGSRECMGGRDKQQNIKQNPKRKLNNGKLYVNLPIATTNCPERAIKHMQKRSCQIQYVSRLLSCLSSSSNHFLHLHYL